MAKILPGIIKISGTIDDRVFVDGVKRKFVRKKQKDGLGKHRPAIVEQNQRTVLLNYISGSINKIIKNHIPVIFTCA